MANEKHKTISVRTEIYDELDAWRRELENASNRRFYTTEAVEIALKAVRGHADEIVHESSAA